MEHLENPLEFVKKDQRLITPFFGKEYLLEYLEGGLGGEAARKIEELIEADPTVAQELAQLRKGLVFAERLRGIEIAGLSLEEFNEPDSYLSVLLEKTNFESWPIPLKWSMEAAVVLGFFMVMVTVVPWDRIVKMSLVPRGQDVVVAEVTRHRDHVEDPAPAAEDPDKIEVAGAELDTEIRPVPVDVAVVPAPSATTTPAAPTAKVEPSPAAPPPSRAKPKREGFLYRGTLYVKDFVESEMNIKTKIEAAGGKKAGEVELGWRRTPRSSYFHFSIPETKHEELMETLNSAGILKIQRETHPRVMPEGLIRLIITVEEERP